MIQGRSHKACAIEAHIGSILGSERLAIQYPLQLLNSAFTIAGIDNRLINEIHWGTWVAQVVEGVTLTQVMT